MLQQPFAVFLVLALLAGVLWLLKRQGLASFNFKAEMSSLRPRRVARRMRVVERLALTQQHSLHLVSIQGRTILFSASPQGCQAIDQDAWESPLPPAAPKETAASC